MIQFMDKDFLLSTQTARTLYHDYAESTPILDYHCHIDAREIYEDKRYPNIAQLWLGVGGSCFGDHYKWRFMRTCGVEEKYITGAEPDEERFVKWAQCLGKAIGNPLYHWSHLELKKYFGFDGALSGKNAREVYAMCNERLKLPEMSVRGIIKQSNVKLICTTDDPADTLEWHEKLAEDTTFDVQVLPAFRPDKAKSIEKPDYIEYLEKLSEAAEVKICSFETLKEALSNRMDFFAARGCCESDHALEYVIYSPATPEKIEAIFAKRLRGEAITAEEKQEFITAFMLYVGEQYSRRNWVMQLHYGAKRDNNSLHYALQGADTGYDCINNYTPSSSLADFLNALSGIGQLPKTVIYSLNPGDNAPIDSVIGCFQTSEAAGKLQHGIAWWFNDHLEGMTSHMTSLANLGNLSGFIGMLTDSRSFLSYTRHEYFRRILCRFIGEYVEEGMYPNDIETLGQIVRDISYNNAVRYFKFNLETC